MTVNNKIKFLLSTLIILGGYVTGSNCYCSDRPNKKGNYDMSTNTFQLSNTDTQAKISKYVINLIDLFERESWNIANNLKLPPLSHSLSLSKLREKYPAIINITSTKDNITILTI